MGPRHAREDRRVVRASVRMTHGMAACQVRIDGELGVDELGVPVVLRSPPAFAARCRPLLRPDRSGRGGCRRSPRRDEADAGTVSCPPTPTASSSGGRSASRTSHRRRTGTSGCRTVHSSEAEEGIRSCVERRPRLPGHRDGNPAGRSSHKPDATRRPLVPARTSRSRRAAFSPEVTHGAGHGRPRLRGDSRSWPAPELRWGPAAVASTIRCDTSRSRRMSSQLTIGNDLVSPARERIPTFSASGSWWSAVPTGRPSFGRPSAGGSTALVYTNLQQAAQPDRVPKATTERLRSLLPPRHDLRGRSTRGASCDPRAVLGGERLRHRAARGQPLLRSSIPRRR